MMMTVLMLKMLSWLIQCAVAYSCTGAIPPDWLEVGVKLSEVAEKTIDLTMKMTDAMEKK